LTKCILRLYFFYILLFPDHIERKLIAWELIRRDEIVVWRAWWWFPFEATCNH